MRLTRRAASGAFIAVGVILLIGAGASVARAAMARDAARARWAAMEAERAAADGRAIIGDAGHWATGPGTPMARIVIPRLRLDEVVVEGVGDAELRAGPGHMIGSAIPGARGNAVISAHRDRHFHPLARLVVGDTIVTESSHGRVSWTVSHIRVVPAAAATLHDSPDPLLTLTTCWPIRYLGPAPDRLIVEAREISTGSAGKATTD